MTKLVGKKVQMTQIYKEEVLVPVTKVAITDGDFASLKEGEVVRVMGISKGKGFQGVVKRHGFHGGPKTHGMKDRMRHPGSIGAGGRQHVIPGTRMAGRMGGDQITLKKVKVAGLNVEKKEIMLKGAVPGHRNSKVVIQL